MKTGIRTTDTRFKILSEEKNAFSVRIMILA